MLVTKILFSTVGERWLLILFVQQRDNTVAGPDSNASDPEIVSLLYSMTHENKACEIILNEDDS